MSLKIDPLPHPDWAPLDQPGCINVSHKPLLENAHFALVMLQFAQNATIHEHGADFPIDVICLEGSGYVSVGGEQTPFKAGERIHWPAHQPHRLWTSQTQMVTLMVEHQVQNP